MSGSTVSRCASFIQTQMRDGYEEAAFPRLALTISRQSHTRGHEIARRLADRLGAGTDFARGEWLLFDQNLVSEVLKDHHLPERLEKFMPEDAVGELNQLMGELLGLHPPMWELFQDTCETIYRLAHVGNVIIMGRAGNLVTRNLPNVVHVRIIGSEANRVREMQSRESISTSDALHAIREDDRARARYVKTYFGKDIDEPSFYDLVLNTDRLDDDAAVEILLQALRSCAATVSSPG